MQKRNRQRAAQCTLLSHWLNSAVGRASHAPGAVTAVTAVTAAAAAVD